MFWSWIRSLLANNNLIQQFTNHYRTDTENAQSTPKFYRNENTSSNTNAKRNSKQNNQTTNNNKINSKTSDSCLNLEERTGNRKLQQEDANTINKVKNKLVNNQFESGSGACLDNICKLLNLNNDSQNYLLLKNKDRNQSRQTESFYQTWLAEYRNMQLKGKQKLAHKVDQVKESLNQLSKEAKREESSLDSSCKNASKQNQFIENRLIRTNEYIDQNLIDLSDQQNLDQIIEQDSEEIREQNRNRKQQNNSDKQTNQNMITQINQIENVKPIFNATDFQFNSTKQNCKINLSINSELVNQIKVSQAQSYHQQLNVSATTGGNITPVFRTVKRSSYPSGLRIGLRILPRLNRDKSRSRLV